MEKISCGAAFEQYGVSTNHERMDNGELRFRLIGPDKSSYIRCENAAGEPVWESSHSHAALQELVLVQSGEVVYVEYRGGRAVFQLLRPGMYVVTTPDVPHNQCLTAHAVVHTVKFGDCSNPDWIAAPQLDALTLPLTFGQARAQAE